MAKDTKPRVLCVDDEASLLEGLEMTLRKQWRVTTALSGAEGLEILQNEGPFEVVISDMRMPEMNGAQFLAKVRDFAPDTTRLLLTGYTDIESAIEAVNDGQIFRFLTKPCPPDQLKSSLDAALKQYQLVTAERELLEKTLAGSIEALTEVLALTNPLAFGIARRVHHHVVELCDALDIKERWHIEIAALVSQLGAIVLPYELAAKHYRGLKLDDDEQRSVDIIPIYTYKLLHTIPRLDVVLDLLHDETHCKGESPEPAVQILRIARDFDELETRELDIDNCLNIMRNRENRYNEAILDTFIRLRNSEHENRNISELPLDEVTPGMVIAQDVFSANGVLMIARGHEVSDSFVERIRQVPGGYRADSVVVIEHEPEMENAS